MGKKVWIVTGLVATALGATAVIAHDQRGSHDGNWGSRDGYQERGDWRRGGSDREHGGWRRGRRDDVDRDMSKSEFDEDTKSRFSKWDANGDGVIDKSEAIAGVSGRMEGRRHHFEGNRIRRMLRRIDKDGDGKVTKAEVEARATKRFQQADLNSDGVVTDADLFPLLRGRNVLRGERLGRRGRHYRHGHGRRLLRHLIAANVDKNDEVTLQEMQDLASKQFQRYDRNNDGVIDKQDRAALRKEIVEYMAMRLLHRYGAGPDGKLTAEQYGEHRSKMFSRRKAERKRRGERRDGWREGRYRDLDDREDRYDDRDSGPGDERSNRGNENRPAERNELKETKPDEGATKKQ